MRTIRIATRGSKLALVQANMIKDSLEALGATCELVIVSTKGDRNQTGALKEIGGKGLFVREIEEYLLKDEADIAVHSGKDLPYELAPGLVIAGVPKAASSFDCLVTVKGHELTVGGQEDKNGQVSSKAKRPVIGTASPRRESELKKMFPEADFQLIRGNVDTRLQKLKDGLYDATLLARAGLDRLGVDLSEFDVHQLTEEECIPAACQGIIGVECRERDVEIAELLGQISDSRSLLRFTVERNLLSLLEADCSVAMGIHSDVALDEEGELRLTIHGMFEGYHGKREGKVEDYPQMCRSLSIELLEGSRIAAEESDDAVKNYL